jgi:hypothetical protein
MTGAGLSIRAGCKIRRVASRCKKFFADGEKKFSALLELAPQTSDDRSNRERQRGHGKMRVLSRVGLGIIVANCLGINGWSTPESTNETELAVAAASLGSSRFLRATDATRTLFAAGLRAIPHLVAQFGDQKEFQGLCGRAILSSEGSPVETDEAGNVMAGLPPRITRISVREVSLYLVLAILRDNLYFAEVCKPVVGPSPGIKANPLGEVLDDIRSMHETSMADGTALNRESIERIVKAHAVTFPCMPGRHGVECMTPSRSVCLRR